MATQTGVITLNGIKIIECDVNPSLAGLSATTGSIACAKDGSGLFYKFDSGDTQWYIYSGDSATVKTLTGDVTSIIDTATVLTDTTFAMEANARYYVYATGRVGCNNTGGIKFGQNSPSGSLCRVRAFGTVNTLASYNTVLLSTSGALYPPSAFFSSVSGAAGMIEFTGIVTNGSTAGDFQFIFASVVAGQTTTVYADSFYMEVKKIN